MKIYDVVREFEPGELVHVICKFKKREFRFYRKELETMNQTEDFREIMGMDAESVTDRLGGLWKEVVAMESDTEIYGYEYRFGRGVNQHNKIAEFACLVCHKRQKRNGLGACPFRNDNEYCNEMMEALEEFDHANRC